MELEQVEALARRIPQLASAQEIRISFLAGGITNQNYRLLVDGESLVIRISGANTKLLGIDRNREAHNHSIAASAGIAPDVIDLIKPEGYLVTRFIHGKKVPHERMCGPNGIREVCRSLHSLHDGPDFAGTFSPFRAVERYLEIARLKNASLPKDIGVSESLAKEIERFMYNSDPPRLQPIHADLLNENFIDDGNAILILDWEYSGMGDIFFDLANLADHHNFAEGDERALLQEYFGELRARDHARLELMRIMSDFREAMWGIVQTAISNLEFDFAGYANEFFDRMRQLSGNGRYREWLRAAAGED